MKRRRLWMSQKGEVAEGARRKQETVGRKFQGRRNCDH